MDCTDSGASAGQLVTRLGIRTGQLARQVEPVELVANVLVNLKKTRVVVVELATVVVDAVGSKEKLVFQVYMVARSLSVRYHTRIALDIRDFHLGCPVGFHPGCPVGFHLGCLVETFVFHAKSHLGCPFEKFILLTEAAAIDLAEFEIVGATATLIVVLVVHPACHTEACTVVQSCLEDRQRPEGASAPSPQMAPQSCISG